MAARIADAASGQVLDVASGTGDIPLRILRRMDWKTGDIERLIVSDICPQMLSLAALKLENKAPNLEFANLDAHDLAGIQSESVDVYSISFAMKICDRERVLAEAMRVLKPGGLFFCLEASRIPVDVVHRAYLGYMNWCLPLIGRLATNGDSSAYEYLLRGVHEFPGQEQFAEELRERGFENVRYDNLTFGIVAMHQGTKPFAG